MACGKLVQLAAGVVLCILPATTVSITAANAQELDLLSIFRGEDLYESRRPSGALALNRTYAREHANHRARIKRYNGPDLGLNQIQRMQSLTSSTQIKKASLGVHNLQISRSGSSVGIGQLKSGKYWVNYPENAGLIEEKAPICALPYYHNAFNDLFVPNEAGFPPIAVVLSQPRKDWEFDPRLLFAKPAEEEKDLFGIEIESAPADMEIGVDVIFYQ